MRLFWGLILLAKHSCRISPCWAAEHHDIPGFACTSPEVLLAHVGAKTDRIRLGSGALLLPHYRPMKVAENFHIACSDVSRQSRSRHW
ncbi:LLM class flavin-dependent oxidoreductase [Paenibacillus sp. GCM10023248]|uniref:LLM class flavin-dependent oxidoreductase n=1 Tax=unclassified Paenibacillus TaxID=185978 RepID=UPI0030835643